MDEKPTGHLELARRRVADAERRVVDQYRLVRRLEAAGMETASACILLDAFEANLATLRAHLAVQEGKAAWISCMRWAIVFPYRRPILLRHGNRSGERR